MHIYHLIDLLTDLQNRLPGNTQVFVMDKTGQAANICFQLDYAKQKMNDGKAYTLTFDRLFLRMDGE